MGSGTEEWIIAGPVMGDDGLVLYGREETTENGDNDFVDRMRGTDGDDFFYARGGDDVVYGGLGNDFLNGQNGVDTLTYEELGLGVEITLHTAATGDTAAIFQTVGENPDPMLPDGWTDTFTNFENLMLTDQKDIVDIAPSKFGINLFASGGDDEVQDRYAA